MKQLTEFEELLIMYTALHKCSHTWCAAVIDYLARNTE